MAIASTSSPLPRSDGGEKSRMNNTRTYGRRGVAAAASASALALASATKTTTTTTTTTTAAIRDSTSATFSYTGSHRKASMLHLDEESSSSSSSSSGSDTELDESIEKQLGLGQRSSSHQTLSRVDKRKGKRKESPTEEPPTSSIEVKTLASKRSTSTLRVKQPQRTASRSSADRDLVSAPRSASRALPSSVLPSVSTSSASSTWTPKRALQLKSKEVLEIDDDGDDDDVEEPPSPPPRKKRPLASKTTTPPVPVLVSVSTTSKPTLAEPTSEPAANSHVPSSQTDTPHVSPTKKRKASEPEQKGARPSSKPRPSTPPPPAPSRTSPAARLSKPSTPNTSRSIAASKLAATSTLAAPIDTPVASPLRSPAKDLSGIFDSFDSVNTSATDGARSTTLNELSPKRPGKIPLKETMSTGSIVAGMAPRRRGFSPELMRQGSLTPTSSRTINALSPRPLGPSFSQPNLSPTRPASRQPSPSRQTSPSTSHIASTTLQNNVVPCLIESGAIAPRASGAGVRKTYGAGGGRSFRRSKDEDELMGINSSGKEEQEDLSHDSVGDIHPERALGFSKTTTGMKTTTTAATLRRSYSSMRIEYGVEEEETILLESQQASSLSSITQLIAKGESTKFTDEVAYLLEGMSEKEASLALRRSSAIELVRKVVEEREFGKRVKSLGLEEAVYKALRRCAIQGGKGVGVGERTGDRCLEVCLAVFLGRIAREQRGFEPLMRVTRGDVGGEEIRNRRGAEGMNEGDVLGMVRGWLEVGWSCEEIGAPAKGVGKAELRSLTILRNLIISNELIGSTSSSGSYPTTLESLAIHLLSTIASFEPRAIFRPQLLVCTSGALKALVGTLMRGSEALERRLGKYEKGLELLPLPEDAGTTTTPSGRSNPHLPLLALQIGVMETCLSVCSEQALEPLTDHSNSIVSSLSTLILVSELVIFGGAAGPPRSSTTNIKTDPDVAQPELRAAMACLSGALKLVLQLTIADARWSAEFVAVHRGRIVGSLVRVLQSAKKRMGEGEGIRRGEDEGEGEADGAEGTEEAARSTFDLDLLCLALGTLTNLVESVDRVKTILRETLLSPTCQERRRCTFVCYCEGREPALAVLARLYLQTPATTNEVSSGINTSFLTGYSGLLLGLTMVDSEPNEALVEEALEGHPQARKELQAAMDDFASLHEAVEEGREGEGDVGYRDREKSQVAGRIREMLRRMKE
ncbi:BQ5605_C048g12379 [Microbotryum silenes-dioicae]|uniref:BQ5605_C048g12379 protein n=1 Tax=Microbotryum silenes-dioicae TaxID=796604 RepID=A0A2X0MSK7_9BASI|nr:BQ5605_C048g12379 [Microbotryum silenes-dioicae]